MLSAIAGCLLLNDAHRGTYDFQAFYCAGAALREHADPYLTEPLRTCEHVRSDGTYAALPPDVALPAPQPPYDIALFALLSLLPFAVAKAVWGAVLGVCIAAAIAALANVTQTRVLTVFMALAASLILPSLAFGQLFAAYAAACALAAFFAQREKWAFAGIAALFTLVEPHLGLPVCLALALWNARARATVCTGGVLLAALCIAAAGWRESLEYAVTVLPLHALSEINSDAQLSLAAVLHAMGFSESAALRAGALSYLAAAAAGVVVGRLLAARTRDAAFVVAAPAAFAVIGGTFIHSTEMVAAIPLALLLVRIAPWRSRALLALVLLSIPWFTVLHGGAPIAFAAISAAVVFYELWQAGGLKVLQALAIAVCAGAFLAAAPALVSHRTVRATAPMQAAYPQASWRALTDRSLSSGAPVTWALRLPNWGGLLLLGGIAVAFAAQRQRLFVNVN
ncbi:MAG TPA: hypothetical protein VJP85_13505 [Candidatus Baltobacteraceae bacterium]|nr:hypothetical protein [Candidatus Baltobacteraceae bacterium]